MIFDDAKEKNKHAVATPEDQNTLHSLKIPRLPLSTRRVLTLSKRTTTTTDRNHLKNNFVWFSPEGWIHCWVWVIGGHDSSPCSQQLTNQIWTRICIPTVFLFCHGMLTWLRQEFRPRIVILRSKKYIRSAASRNIWLACACSYILIFF